MAKGVAKTPEAEKARRQKISEGRARRKAMLGYLNAPDTRRRMSESASARVASPATRAAISAALKGRRPKNFDMALALAHAAPKKRGAEANNWRGDAVKYGGLHSWVRRELGKPGECAHCGTKSARKFEWANKSGEYRRDVTDWLRLCTRCHRRYDNGQRRAAKIKET